MFSHARVKCTSKYASLSVFLLVCVCVCVYCIYTGYILYNLSDIVAVAIAAAAVGAVVISVNVSGLVLRLAVYVRHTTVRISNFRNVALCLQYAQEKKLQQKGWQALAFTFNGLTVAGSGSGLIYKLLPGCAL